VFHWLPGANAIRAVSRIGIFLLFPASYALALFVEQAQGHRLRLVRLAAAVLSLLEQGRTASFFEKIPLRQKVDSLARRIDRKRCAAFFYSPSDPSRRVDYAQLDAVWAYLASGVPTLNGYSGNAPPEWGLGDAQSVTDADETRLAAAIGDWESLKGLSPQAVCWIKP
jgi:hypothetical protein